MQEFLFPAVTAVSLICAGILMGYLLWYRDRAFQLIRSERLTRENEQFAAELSDTRSRLEDLESQLDFRNDRQSQMQQLCDDLLAGRERADRHASEVERELYETRRRLEQVREQLTAECGLRNETEQRLHEARQNYLHSVADLQRQWQAKMDESRCASDKQGQALTREMASREQAVQQLHQARTENAELKSELEAQFQLLEMAKRNAAGLEQEHVSLESTMRSQIEQLNEARGQAAAENSARKIAEIDLAACRAEIDELHLQLQKLENVEAALASVKSQCGTLEEAIANERSRIKTMTGERDAALVQAEQAHTKMLAYQKRSGNQEVTIRQLRHQMACVSEVRVRQAVNESEELRQQCLELKQALADSEKRNQAQVKRLELAAQANADIRTELDDMRRLLVDSSAQADVRLNSLLQQRDQALKQNTQLQDELNRVRRQAEANERTIRNLRRERGAVLMRNRQTEPSFPRIHQNMFEQAADVNELAREYGGIAQRDRERGIVFTAPPRVCDDLKRIHGIGAVLQERLNGFGIYTFKQIMQWDNRAVDKFSELLIFKDRILRDDWMGQAATLYHLDRRQRVA